MMIARRYLILACLSLVVVPQLCGGEAVAPRQKKPPSETREHYVLIDSEGGVQYEITEVRRNADDLQENVVIVEDTGHGAFLLTRQSSWEDGLVQYSLTDVKQKDYIRTSFKMPTAAKTAKAAIEEARRHPELLMAPVVLTVTTNGGEWAAVSSEWEEWTKLRTLRHSIRRTVPFYLLEALERMRGAVLTEGAGEYFGPFIANFVLYDIKDESKLALKKVSQVPSCEFDAAHGFPCSAAQMKSVKAARDAGKQLESY